MPDGLVPRVRASHEEARAREDSLHGVERVAQTQPTAAAEFLMALTVNMRRLYRRYLRSRFGVKVSRLDRPGGILDRSRAPRNRREKDLCLNAVAAHTAFETAWWGMVAAAQQAAPRGEDPAPAVWEAFVKAGRAAPILHATVMGLATYPPLKERATVSISGWLATQLSVNKNYRMSRALREIGDGSAFETLLQVLPATALLAWSERQTGEPFRSGTREKSFVSRVDQHVSQMATEATGKQGSVGHALLSDALLSEPNAEDPALAEFEVREAARQQLDALEQRAGLSAQQAEVWAL